jgi:SAM-dependent methyltransferase
MSVDLDAFGFSSYTGFNAQLIRWRYAALSRHFTGSRCLELGSSDGQGTGHLLDYFDHVTAVDGSEEATARLRELFPDERLTVTCSYFEDLDLPDHFDTVIAAHVLEHVDDPSQLLAVAKRHVAPEGRVLVDVPNALSLHRQLGVLMGMLQTETALNDADLSIGHQRVYTPEHFRAEVAASGLELEHFGGIFLKLLSNAQTEQAFDEAQLRGMLALGERYPELASEIYVVARPPAPPPRAH